MGQQHSHSPLSKEEVRRAEDGSPQPRLYKRLGQFVLFNFTVAFFAIVGAFVWGWAIHMIERFWHYGWALVS